ncbi:MAG: hypothetical protein AAF664_06085 [Planctomycetota bacterium]
MTASARTRISFMFCLALIGQSQARAASPDSKPLVIETKVLDVSSDKVVGHHRIVFSADRIVDFNMQDDQRPVVYDLKAGEIREVFPENSVSIREVVSAMESVAKTVTNPKHRETLGLDVEVTVNSSDGVYEASFGGARYELHTDEIQGGPATVALPLFVRLASALNWHQQRGLPPFARLALYDRVSADGRMVNRTKLIIEHGSETQQLQGTTEIVPITAADRSRIESVDATL